MFKLPFIKQDDSNQYKTMEVEAELIKNNQELIESLRNHIETLTRENLLLHSLLTPKTELEIANLVHESGKSFEAIKQKPHLRTMAEVRNALEEKSRRKIGEGKGAKDAKDISPDAVIGMP